MCGTTGSWRSRNSPAASRDQFRFDFDPARFDSTSARLSWNPTANWSLQVSWGFLKSPEQLEPDVNETRYTASASYVTPLGDDSSLAATVAFGRKQLTGGTAENGFLAEAEYKPRRALDDLRPRRIHRQRRAVRGPRHPDGGRGDVRRDPRLACRQAPDAGPRRRLQLRLRAVRHARLWRRAARRHGVPARHCGLAPSRSELIAQKSSLPGLSGQPIFLAAKLDRPHGPRDSVGTGDDDVGCFYSKRNGSSLDRCRGLLM